MCDFCAAVRSRPARGGWEGITLGKDFRELRDCSLILNFFSTPPWIDRDKLQLVWSIIELLEVYTLFRSSIFGIIAVSHRQNSLINRIGDGSFSYLFALECKDFPSFDNPFGSGLGAHLQPLFCPVFGTICYLRDLFPSRKWNKSYNK